MVYPELETALKEKINELRGKKTSMEEVEMLKTALPALPSWFLDIIAGYPLCGASFFLNDELDQSGLGAELSWMKPSHIIEEAVRAEPGKSVLGLGYIPFGSDLSGGGDPYFLAVTISECDPPVVRVPHDYAVQSPYPIDEIELVSPALSQFIRSSSVLADHLR